MSLPGVGRNAFAGLEILQTELELDQRIKNGLPYAETRALRIKLGVDCALLSKLTRVPVSVLKARRRLSPAHSERIVRFERILTAATLTLGSDARAISWLTSGQLAFGGISPCELLETEPGSRAIEQVLGRLDHGVYQ